MEVDSSPTNPIHIVFYSQDTVGMDASQVCKDQYIRHSFGIFGRYAHFFQSQPGKAV
jgi:hypothetical protein